MTHESRNIARYTPWQPGAFKKARRRRMRLAWSVWVVAAAFVLFQFFLQLSSGEFISELMKSFALTAFGGGVLASSYYYIYVLLQTPAGMLMDRYGPRGILSVGALVVCAGCLIFANASSVILAFVGRLLMGGGSAFAFVGCLSVISIWFPKRRFSFMAATVETVGMLGAIVGNFWLASIIRNMGWRYCMVIAAVVAGVLSALLVMIVRNAPRKKKPSIITIARTSLWHGLKGLLKNPLIWMNGVYSGLMFGIVTVFIALWAIPFYELSHQASLVQATFTVSTLYAGVALGGPLIGWLDGKTYWRRQMMIFNAFCASLCLFLAIWGQSFSLITIGILLFITGICASSYVLTFAIANELAGSANSSTSIGFTNMLCVIFAPILQPLIGFLITHWNHQTIMRPLTQVHMITHFEWAVSIVPELLVLCGIIAFFLPGRQR